MEPIRMPKQPALSPVKTAAGLKVALRSLIGAKTTTPENRVSRKRGLLAMSSHLRTLRRLAEKARCSSKLL